MSYYIILFPSLDVSSAFPLINVTVANNIYIMITGVDTSQAHKRRYGRLIKIVLRVICAVIPIFAALFITNLVFIVSYAGLLGLTMCYFFPIALQLKSQLRCYIVFSKCNWQGGVSLSPDNTNTSEDVNQPLLLRQARREDAASPSWWWNPAYSTPYATVFSHPISVMIFAVLSCWACGFAIASLAEPQK